MQYGLDFAEKESSNEKVFEENGIKVFINKAIRGMLPYKQERGIKAYKRIKSFMGVPESYKNQFQGQ